MLYRQLFLVVLFLSSSSVFALSSQQEQDTRLKLQSASKGVVVIKKLFNGPDGLIGAVVGDDRIAWVLDNGYVAFGALFNPSGDNITVQAKKALFTDKRPPLLKSLEKTNSAIRIGHAGPVIAYIHDISCPYCKKAWQRLQKPLADGLIQLDVYIVAGQKPKTDMARIAKIYLSNNPAQYFKDSNGGHDIPPTTMADFKDYNKLTVVYKRIELNTKLFLTLLKRPATPTFISGNKIYQSADVSRFLPELKKGE